MGCVESSPRDPQDRMVSKEMNEARLLDDSITKLLLLGAGGSGKSTFFKQLQTIHGDGFDKSLRNNFKMQLFEQIIDSMKIMITSCEEKFEETEDDKWKISSKSEEPADSLLSVRNNAQITGELVNQLTILWNDPAIRAVFDIRNLICIPDSTGTFLDKLDKLADPGYVCTNEDVLLIRYRTTGIAEKEFVIQDNRFLICDVGGQRNERRKWVHFFENVGAVLFVASLSAYDEVVFEDDEANAMIEALEIFEEILSSHWFSESALILFLNKNDVMREKVLKVSINVCWPEFQGSGYEESVKYIREQFFKQRPADDDREIHCHVTQATDTNNVERIFDSVVQSITDWSLRRAGLA